MKFNNFLRHSWHYPTVHSFPLPATPHPASHGAYIPGDFIQRRECMPVCVCVWVSSIQVFKSRAWAHLAAGSQGSWALLLINNRVPVLGGGGRGGLWTLKCSFHISRMYLMACHYLDVTKARLECDFHPTRLPSAPKQQLNVNFMWSYVRRPMVRPAAVSCASALHAPQAALLCLHSNQWLLDWRCLLDSLLSSALILMRNALLPSG